MKNLLKEPLFHFMLLGGIIFFIYSGIQQNTDNENQIVIDKSDINHLKSVWQLQWQRPPTKEELEHLITEHINQEIFYREALNMNLDHNDEIVKRRLAQKMRFVSSDLSALVKPANDKNLRAFFKKNQNNYKTGQRYDISQIIFTTERHKNARQFADSILKSNSSASLEALLSLGDPIPIKKTFVKADESVLAREIGADFTKNLVNLPLNTWAGPVSSGFGIHLVYISKKEAPEIPAYNEVKAKVIKDYQYATEKESEEAILKELKTKYKIKFTSDDIDKDVRDVITENIVNDE